MGFVIILVAHWVGDYAFQTTKMATQKSAQFQWLLLHVAVYTSILFVFVLWVFPLETALLYTVVNGVLHLATDFITSKVAAKYQDRPRIFYPILGFDQMVHGLCLYLTFLEPNLLLSI
ncbi:MAG: DUF3307 domain-containing protein [Bacteroidota bacterium]